MSHSHEPSYYEIALTNRQVLVIFIVLLVCVVVAFFSGVWVGQRDRPAPVARVAQEDTAETLDEIGEEAAVGELHFFSDQQGAAEEESSLAEMAGEPKPGTTLLEDLGVPESGAEPQEAAPTPEAPEAAAESPTRPVPAAATPAPAPPPTTSGAHVVQVFSSSDEAQAQQLLRRLGEGGYPAFLSPVEVEGQTMFRVRLGPYTELAEAEKVADRVRRAFKLDTWVTR